MSIEKAIWDQWEATPGLADLITPEKVFIGEEAALLNSDEETEVLPPFATIFQGDEITERTSTQHLLTTEVHIRLFYYARADARTTIFTVKDTFDRAGFAWEDGDILDMRPGRQTEKQGPDGLWQVDLEFAVLATQAVS